MNIEILQGTLEISENPGLETIDPRFSDITTLVQGGQYEEAAIRSEEILSEKIYDIRIIGYFLYGVFLEQGIPAMTDIYMCLTDLLGDNINALGPVKNRGKHIQTILNWMMRQLLKKVQYEEQSGSSIYQDWTASVSSDQIDEILDAGGKFRRVLSQALEDTAGPVIDGMTKLNEWLASFQRLVYREHQAEPEEEQEPELTEAAGAESEEEAPREKRKKKYEPALEEEEIPGVEGSYHLKLLIKKLEAFDTLISAQKYASAAIVADDINAVIANFDPRIYFPNLFVNFVLQFAANINNLVAYAEYKDSVAWQALQELYKVDLESFVDFDPDSIEMGTSGASGGYGEPDEYGAMPEEEDQ
jgi:hypothetical protein